jgi:hypothetical protein
MSYGKWLMPVAVLATASSALGATKNAELPDKEMLRMMEFLKEMEMLKQLDMLKELQDLDAGDSAKTSNPKPASSQKKGSAK